MVVVLKPPFSVKEAIMKFLATLIVSFLLVTDISFCTPIPQEGDVQAVSEGQIPIEEHDDHVRVRRETPKNGTETTSEDTKGKGRCGGRFPGGFGGFGGFGGGFFPGVVNPGFTNPNLGGFVNPNQGLFNPNLGFGNPNLGFGNPNFGFNPALVGAGRFPVRGGRPGTLG